MGGLFVIAVISVSMQTEGCWGDPGVSYNHLAYVTSLAGHWPISQGAYLSPNLSRSMALMVSSVQMRA